MKQPLDDFFDNPMTMDKLEEILSDSQIKAKFFEFGYGIFTVYRYAYKKFGKFEDPYDNDFKRYGAFAEAEDDIKYIESKNGGKSLLKKWFDDNREYIDRRIFGRYYYSIRNIEKMLIDNRIISDFVYNELTANFLNFLFVSSESNGRKDYKENIVMAYKKALESVYRLYIQKALV